MKLAEEAKRKYTYDPVTGVVFSIRKQRRVRKNGMVCGRQLRPYQIAFLIMEGKLPASVDHKDGDTDNNVWKNLREATNAQQSANTKKEGIRCWPSGVWYYQLCVNGKRHYKSGFATRLEAQKEYDELCVKLQGEFSTQVSRAKKEDE